MIMLRKTIAVYAVAASLLISADLTRAQVTDQDMDGLSDVLETRVYFTNPTNPDTDGDGRSDGHEIDNGYSPLEKKVKKLSEVDTDKDGLNDSLEIQLGTFLNDPDFDDDGKKDGEEVFAGFSPWVGNGSREVLRHVEVDLNTQQMAYFMNGVKLGIIQVATGKRQTPTPVGEFEILRKVPVIHYRGEDYDLPNTKWNLEFKRTYYLHGAYWHNQFGIQPMSHGCVNIAYKDVEKLYKYLDVGDKVKVTGKTPTKAQVAAAKKAANSL